MMKSVIKSAWVVADNGWMSSACHLSPWKKGYCGQLAERFSQGRWSFFVSRNKQFFLDGHKNINEFSGEGGVIKIINPKDNFFIFC